MVTKLKQFDLLKVAIVPGARVNEFKGTKQYVATADIDLNHIIGGKKVTYEDRPGRADLVMCRGDVLFAKMKNTIKVLIGSPEVEDKIFSTGFYILKPKENISKKYLYFYLLSDEFNKQKDQYCLGATMSAISDGGLKRIKISVPIDSKGNPDIKEQERIATLLEEAEELKRKRSEINQKMAEVIPALFNKMFGDPIANPMDWQMSSLLNVCEKQAGIKAGPFGSSLKKNSYTKEGPRVYGQEQVIAGDFSVGDYHVSEEKFNEMSAYAVQPGDLLISLVGTIGKVIIVPENIEKGIINPRLIRIRPQTEIVNKTYLVHLLTSSSVTKFFNKSATGITMGVLNASILKRLIIPLPPLKLQDEFEEKIEGLVVLEKKQKESTEQINNLFLSLLSNNFTQI